MLDLTCSMYCPFQKDCNLIQLLTLSLLWASPYCSSIMLLPSPVMLGLARSTMKSTYGDVGYSLTRTCNYRVNSPLVSISGFGFYWLSEQLEPNHKSSFVIIATASPHTIQWKLLYLGIFGSPIVSCNAVWCWSQELFLTWVSLPGWDASKVYLGRPQVFRLLNSDSSFYTLQLVVLACAQVLLGLVATSGCSHLKVILLSRWSRGMMSTAAAAAVWPMYLHDKTFLRLIIRECVKQWWYSCSLLQAKTATQSQK